jgi:hypothetical protein
MQSTLNPKPSDDPHDFVVVPPDVVGVAPADDELSNLLQKAARHRPDPQTRGASADSTVPPVDATFRPAAVDEALAPGNHASIAGRLARGFAALLLAACIALAGVAWKSYGDVARKQIAKWTTQFVLVASQPPEPTAAAAPAAPAEQKEAAAASPPPTPPAQSATETAAPAATPSPEATAPSPESAQLLQLMSRDLASLGQEVEQLKASIEQLKAGQQQMSREVAVPPEQNLRPRKPAPSPRPAVARTRKPTPSYPSTQAAVAPMLPPAAAPYYPSRQPDYAPRQLEPQPQFSSEPPADPELSSVPRPPMPMRGAD